MKLTYDSRYNVAYLRLSGKSPEVEMIKISDQLNIDIAPDGRIFGIELLNANEQLLGDDGILEVINAAQGDRKQIVLNR